MLNSFTVLKRYYKLSGINLKLILLEFIILIIPSLLSIWSTILTASIISSITIFDFDGALFKLCLDFAIIVISAILYFCYFLLENKINKIITINFHNYLYNNVKINENITKINISNINNITTCVNFNKDFLYKICFFIKAIILICVISYYSLAIGLSLVAVSIISYILLNISDKKIQKNTKLISKYELESVELFNSIKKGVTIEQDYNLNTPLKDKYFYYVDNNIDINKKIRLSYNINNNFISLILKISVFICTIILINQVKSTTLTLASFLFLTPYLTSSTTNLISFFDIFSKFGIIENILNELETLKFSKQNNLQQPNISLSSYNIYCYNTSINYKDLLFNNLNLQIKFGSIINFVGPSKEIKPLFYLLTKKQMPSGGVILLGDKNISDIPIEYFNKIVSTSNNNPHFFNISVMENLLLVNNNKQKILSAIKSFGLQHTINSLQKKYNTIINEDFSTDILYFLGILRCYLADTKIINIYEIPHTFELKNITILKNILKFLKNKCTIIIYSNNDILNDICTKTYYVENRLIKNI